jgi:hypothetical protein
MYPFSKQRKLITVQVDLINVSLRDLLVLLVCKIDILTTDFEINTIQCIFIYIIITYIHVHTDLVLS